MLTIKNLTFGWQPEPVFQDINCHLNQGDIVQLTGENGAGKTTLLKLISGMIPHFSRGEMLQGNIFINGRSILNESPQNFFPTIAFVPNVNLEFFLWTETVHQEILLTSAVLQIDSNKIQKSIAEFSVFFPAISKLLDQHFDKMLHAEKILALTFIFYLQNARLYLVDEILSNYSVELVTQWYSFFDWLSSKQCAVIFVDHNQHRQKYAQWLLKDKKLILLPQIS